MSFHSLHPYPHQAISENLRSPPITFTVSAGEDTATCSGDESRTKIFNYIWVKSGLSRKAESAGEICEKPYVRTDCAEFKPVEMRRWVSGEAGSPVACSGEEVTRPDPHIFNRW